jgi:hypothetical protein
LYGCETWFLTLREEHRLGAFENGVLRRVFGPKREEVIGCRRRLLEELRVIKSGTVVCMGEMRNTKFWSET